MKTVFNENLVFLIYEKVEKHLNEEFKIGLKIHNIPISNDRRVMKNMLQQKAVNLS